MSDPYRIPTLGWIVLVPFISVNAAVVLDLVSGVIPDILRLVLGIAVIVVLGFSYWQHRARQNR